MSWKKHAKELEFESNNCRSQVARCLFISHEQTDTILIVNDLCQEMSNPISRNQQVAMSKKVRTGSTAEAVATVVAGACRQGDRQSAATSLGMAEGGGSARHHGSGMDKALLQS